jgi:flagellar basal-body rod protein FlgB
MLRFKMFGRESFPLVFKALDAYALRHKTISDNVANVDTPGYERKTVPFEEDLRQAIKVSGKASGFRTNPRHMELGIPAVNNMKIRFESHKDEEPVNGINSVDIDKEMSELAQNTLRYSMMVSFLNKKLGDIRSAITEGKK